MFGVSAVNIGTVTAGTLVSPNTGYAGYKQEYRIWNNSGQTLWVGGTTAATGFPVPANTGITVTLGENESVVGIATGGTVDARILQI